MKPLPAQTQVRAETALVLVVRATLDAEQQAAVEQACASLGVRTLSWSDDREAANEGWPSLLIAGLPPAARRLPSSVCDLLRGPLPGVPIVLLCNEPLRRPTMTSHGGRVVLLDPSCSAQQLGARLRMILSGSGRWRSRSPDVAEQFREGHWVGVYRRASGGARPSVENHKALGLTVMFSLSGDRVSPSLLDSATNILAETSAGPEQERSFSALVGEEYAVVHLDSRRRHWKVYLPRADSLLQLRSPVRLPRRWDFKPSGLRPRCVDVPSVDGDLLIACTRATQGLQQGEGCSTGARVLDSLVTSPAPDDFAAVVVELL